MKQLKSYFPSFWVKVFSVILMFLSIGFTKIQAQNYKPLNEAVASVQNAIEVLKTQGGVKTAVPKAGGSGQSTTGALTPAQSNNALLLTFELAYYDQFLYQAKANQDVALAVQALDASINAQGQPQSRVSTYNSGRTNLIALITN
jgi:hypothetical protein